MDWNDLRSFLAIARTGSLQGAARTLAVNHSTVFRRLNALEARLGVRLFERSARGYALTAAGEQMLASAERVEDEILGLERRLRGGDVRLSGVLGLVLGYLGWGPLLVGVYAGFLLGGVGGGLLTLLRVVDRKAYPFGPFMLLGALVGVLWGSSIGELYIGG